MLYTGSGFESSLLNVLPMKAAHVRALIDGQFFLEHGARLLADIAVEPYCCACAAAGESPEIRSEAYQDRWNWVCAHRAGYVRQGQPLDVPALLQSCGWNLRCTRCHADVAANNHPNDPAFFVNCPCTTRHMANPTRAEMGTPLVGSSGRA